MSLFVDLKYINMISHRLERFKRKDDYLFNCRCPICGDSSGSKIKARGYIYKKEDGLFYRCHNCDFGTTLGKFVEQLDPTLYKEYVLEKFIEPKKKIVTIKKKEPNPEYAFDFKPAFDKPSSLISSLMDRLDTLSDNHEVVRYVKARKIPESTYNRLYYVDDIRDLSQLNSKYAKALNIKQPRLAMPFIRMDGQLSGVALRDIRGGKLRYINLKVKEEDPTVFGMDVVDLKREIFVVEGPIDSLFIDNSIAAAGSAFNKIDLLGLTHFTVIFDNQPRNKEICSLIHKQIKSGNRVCLFPEDIVEKDINDMVLAGLTTDNISSIINNNTYEGLEAELRFTEWRKC
jgi:hypothetical protein|tara:strand:+ start:48 stop:1079 length:1032 start_codon:yes stop_codon:yes gene_type:complete